MLKDEDAGKFIAIGECGLDYDRLERADKEMQKMVFLKHFELSEAFNLPLYLHARAAGDDFVNIIKKNRKRFTKGVVHCFTGSEEYLAALLKLDLYIGVTGLSFKTAENCEMVKKKGGDVNEMNRKRM